MCERERERERVRVCVRLCVCVCVVVVAVCMFPYLFTGGMVGCFDVVLFSAAARTHVDW